MVEIARARALSVVMDRGVIVAIKGRGGMFEQIRNMRPIISIQEDDFV